MASLKSSIVPASKANIGSQINENHILKVQSVVILRKMLSLLLLYPKSEEDINIRMLAQSH